MNYFRHSGVLDRITSVRDYEIYIFVYEYLLQSFRVILFASIEARASGNPSRSISLCSVQGHPTSLSFGSAHDLEADDAYTLPDQF